jgi:hypothetical protein
MQLMLCAYLAFVGVVLATSVGNPERRRTLLLGGLGCCLAVLGLISIAQGQVAGGIVALILAGIELGLFALIRATRPTTGRVAP